MIAALLFGLISQETVVFQSGEDQFDTYRIPSLLRTSKGTLLAFAEARESENDAANNSIVLKTSMNQGETWSSQTVIAKPKGGSFNNPCVVQSGSKLILHFQHYPKGTYEYNVEPGFAGARIVSAYQIESQDDGKTWTSPKDITTQVKPSKAATIASGPGIGITLNHHNGRILMPYNFRAGNRWWVYAAISDNQGKTWHQGNFPVSQKGVNANEVQMAELSDGTIFLNARNQGSIRARCIAKSKDGGENFTPIQIEPNLIDPICQGSLIADNERQTLYFSNANSEKARENGTIWRSKDQGKTWKRVADRISGSFQYSSLQLLSPRNLGILYERVKDKKYQIMFKKIELD
jgi:sialidase-1